MDGGEQDIALPSTVAKSYIKYENVINILAQFIHIYHTRLHNYKYKSYLSPDITGSKMQTN